MVDPATLDDGDRNDARKELFDLLLKRLRHLHFQQVPPKKFYIGQNYAEDRRRIKCEIAFHFNYPAHIEGFEFYHQKSNVKGFQYGNILLIKINRIISSNLWDDLRLKGLGDLFIIGYICQVLPKINHLFLDNRYSRGHPLSRTFAIFEAFDVSVTVGNRRLFLHWPTAVEAFPPTVMFSSAHSHLYIRDYIDAILSYYRNDFDDCVRRVITSAENFMSAENWVVKKPAGNS